MEFIKKKGAGRRRARYEYIKLFIIVILSNQPVFISSLKVRSS